MSGLTIRRFENEADIRISADRWVPNARQERESAEIWREAAADSSRYLTDEPILCVSGFGQTIEATPVPYRYFFAQKERPELFPDPLTALAVTGILHCEGRFLVGRRATWVLQDPGTLELVPSGGVDERAVSGSQIDVRKQLDCETGEELGVDPHLLSGHRLLGAVQDNAGHALDIVIEANVNCTLDQLFEAHSRLQRPEYSEVRALTADEFQRMIADGSEPVSAVSSAIFASFCAAPE